LQQYRLTGAGPVYVQIGTRRIGYRLADLDAWLDAHKRRSTSDQGGSGMTASMVLKNLGQVFLYMTKLVASHADSKTEFEARIAELPAAEQAAFRAWMIASLTSAAVAAMAAGLPADQRRQILAGLIAEPLYPMLEGIEPLAGDLDAAEVAVRPGECQSVAPLVAKLRQRIGELGLHLMRLGTAAAVQGRKRDQALEAVAAGKAA
jgi:hypothetical protein